MIEPTSFERLVRLQSSEVTEEMLETVRIHRVLCSRVPPQHAGQKTISFLAAKTQTVCVCVIVREEKLTKKERLACEVEQARTDAVDSGAEWAPPSQTDSLLLID